MSGSAADRRRAVAVAGHTGDVDTARAHLDDESARVRSAALGALSRLGALTAAELEAGLDDPDAEVRRRALSICATRAGNLPPACVPALDDADPVVAETAAWACGERTPPEPGAAAALARLATDHPEHLVREAAVAALGAIGDPIGLDAVLAAMGERATIRRRAVVALAAFEGPDVEAALRQALEDRDRQVRQTAEDLIS
ncbi:MAG: HEAT repeat domain-containing protein [Acidimicrobiales bacterium]|nr:HEAT repeat domain-containing protein [Acidimicrobiales bacterium]